MPRKKQLKTNGSLINSHQVVIGKIKSEHLNSEIEVVLLNIITNDGEYKYRINKDERAPDLNQIRDHIDTSLTRAKKEYLKVDISEYHERYYLFFEIQSIGRQQYSGSRI